MTEDGRRSRRIRRCDDRAEGDRQGPRNFRYQRADNHGDRHGGHRDAKHDEIDERYPVVLQIPRRRVECRVEKNRRNEERQCQARFDRKGGRPRHKRQDRASDGEKRWIWNAHSARHRCEEDSGEQQAKQRDEFGHRIWADSCMLKVTTEVTE